MVNQENFVKEVTGYAGNGTDHLNEPALRYARHDFPIIRITSRLAKRSP
jgi:hypothetical protein